MELPTSVRFILINHLTESDVKNSAFTIYAHKCSDGVYVGMSKDPVERWQQHVSDAHHENNRNYDDNFRASIRRCGRRFEHYIIAVAGFEKAAKRKEAAAIEFYGDRLNMKKEVIDNSIDYRFSPIGTQIGTTLILKKKTSRRVSNSIRDVDRETVIAEIYNEFGRRRLRVIEGQNFPKGMNIRCDNDERMRFEIGDKVKIKVAKVNKDGTDFLQAGKASFVLV